MFVLSNNSQGLDGLGTAGLPMGERLWSDWWIELAYPVLAKVSHNLRARGLRTLLNDYDLPLIQNVSTIRRFALHYASCKQPD
jgi:hypothetical protein